MKKGFFALVFIITSMVCSAICYADTVTMPYGSSNIITQTIRKVEGIIAEPI